MFAFGSPLPNDPTRPTTSFKTAWIKVRQKAGATGRWHDNRHTLVTELAESGAGDEVMMSIAGHALRAMVSRYSHVRIEAKFLAGQEADLRESCRPGSPDRPPWIDVRLDDRAAMNALHLRLWPIMVRSLQEAGYHCLGDLRWASVDEIIRVFYIGRKTAKQIRAAIERLEEKHVA